LAACQTGQFLLSNRQSSAKISNAAARFARFSDHDAPFTRSKAKFESHHACNITPHYRNARSRSRPGVRAPDPGRRRLSHNGMIIRAIRPIRPIRPTGIQDIRRICLSSVSAYSTHIPSIRAIRRPRNSIAAAECLWRVSLRRPLCAGIARPILRQRDLELGVNLNQRTAAEVQNPTNEPPGTIVIDTGSRHLYLVQPGGGAIQYGIGVGRQGFEWKGVARVGRKSEWPRWILQRIC